MLPTTGPTHLAGRPIAGALTLLLICAALAACGGGAGSPSSSGGIGDPSAGGGTPPSSPGPGVGGAPSTLPAGPAAFYLSPSGNDRASCRSADTACRSFATVFARMPAGGELVLLDGR